MARYPEIRVSTRSANPLALVAAVRAELRRNRVDPEEISRFSDEAMARAGDGTRLRELCLDWVGEVIGGAHAGAPRPNAPVAARPRYWNEISSTSKTSIPAGAPARPW
jgi:hypothetical protein